MLHKKIVIPILFVSMAFCHVQAAIIKSETFEDQNLNDWLLTNGPRSVVTNYVRSGNYAGKHTLIGQVGVQAGFKNESWRVTDLDDFGEYWVGFSVYIVDGGTEDWIFDQYSHDSIFFQILHQADFNLGESPKGYPIKMHIRNNEFTITHGGSTVNPHTSSSRVYTSSSLGTVTKGIWHDFVLYMKFDPPNPANCAIKVWHNGTLKVDKSNFIFGNEGPGYNVKFGIYQPDWRDGFADVDKRWIYHDEIRIGDAFSSYNEVAPRGTPGGTGGGTTQVEAESYDSQNGTSLHSNDGGQTVGFTNSGSWTKYNNVNLQGGVNQIKVRIASDAGTTPGLELRLNSHTGTLLGSVATHNGSWTNYTEKTFSITNTTGVQDLVFVRTGGQTRMNWFEFDYAAGGGGVTTRLQTESYDSQNATVLKSNDGGQTVEFQGGSAWVKFNNVDLGTGINSIKFRCASDAGVTPTLEVRLNSETGTLLGTINASTGSWTNYQEKNMTVTTTTGVQDIVIKAVGGYSRVNWIEFTTL